MTAVTRNASTPERLRPADVASLHAERANTVQHVGGLSIFQIPADGFDYDRLVRLLEERIALVPRYRQRVLTVPGRLAAPVWVDDTHFDITYHVRRSALPRPGDEQALLDVSARILSRLLDRDRPLWEMYLIEGLASDRFAVLTKTHQAMIDGVGAIDIEQVLLDAAPRPRRTVGPVWMPAPEPGRVMLVRDAVHAALTAPLRSAAALARVGVSDGQALARQAARATGRHLGRARPASPLIAVPGRQRRLAFARTSLADYRQVRDAQGGTVNDVALATLTGALRAWLVGRRVELRPNESVRALVPVTVGGQGGIDPVVGGDVGALLVDLPVGEPDPLRRLAHIRYAMAVHRASGRSVRADALAGLRGFAPPTLHALGTRAAAGLTRRMFHLVVTNVPGPQQPMYAAGARMIEMFPVLPLAAGQALSVGMTSYDGALYVGINADRDAAPDVAALADAVATSLAELVTAACPPREVQHGARGPRSRR
ncbi:MAG: wax ester/triacylglycerol synthase family O-acyltransferase [Jatrophihabitans sp.]|nr:MAG: wax ester/triacylglycerol synthase family O-acyltransferase [Jatrophihabitans sp.]